VFARPDRPRTLDKEQAVNSGTSPDDATRGLQRLREFIRQNLPDLVAVMKVYASYARLSRDPNDLTAVAKALLARVIVEAQARAAELNRTAQIHAWFLEIAASLIDAEREQVISAQDIDEAKVISTRAADKAAADIAYADALLNTLTTLAGADWATNHRRLADIERLIAPLSPEHRQTIRIGLEYGFEPDRFAAALGVSAGEAYLRLFKALRALRRVKP
jgi:DNA-directed RNA polymerase specialized sigma24 family protein